MKYYEVTFTITAPEALLEDARDIISALAGQAGFETFEETPEGLKGYVQQTLFNKEELNQLLTDFPFQEAEVSYEVSEAEDRDWNEQWEQEGFDPIIIGNKCVVHDGRHLPSVSYPLEIEIDAKLAFGTGSHETTRLLLGMLCDLEAVKGARVLDCGTGTGILAIATLKIGAKEAVGYDIDEWSADNARHNAVINFVDNHFTSLLGDASLLDTLEGTFNVVTANINRNILLQDMPQFHQKMADGAYLLLSGFYSDDVPMLIEKATSLGLHHKDTRSDGNWNALLFRK